MEWLLLHFFIVDFVPFRRFRNRRRYSLVNQREDTDALLDDDDDEPPLDLRSDSRDDGRSRDDGMLDLGTGTSLFGNSVNMIMCLPESMTLWEFVAVLVEHVFSKQSGKPADYDG